MTNRELKKMVINYYEKLKYIHPIVGSEKFIRNSYSKWACKEILDEIEKAKDMPFDFTPIELLSSFVDQMNNYACKNANNSMIFVIAAETAEYFIEEYWRRTVRKEN